MGDIITMSTKELSRLEIVQRLQMRELRQERAAEMLGISIRQVKRLLAEYRTKGPPGLISRKRGKVSDNRLSASLNQAIKEIIRKEYPDFGPTLAWEKLNEVHHLNVSLSSVRRLMLEDQIWITRDNKLKRSYQPRYRRAATGELVQIDGSDHDWFEGRSPKCTLLVFVDDATSKLMGLRFVPHESAFTYFLVTKEYLLRYGKPVAFYSDKLGIFRVNQKSPELKGEGITQFGRALNELNIQIICANSCQAKGRVERANKTLQDRLVKELRLRSINTVEEANAYLPEFIEDYNKRFGKVPISTFDAHRPLLPHEDLTNIFCWKEDRTVTHNLTVQYDKCLYLIEDSLQDRKLRRKRITVYDYENGNVNLFDRIAKVDSGAIVNNKRLGPLLELIKREQEENPTKLRNQRGPSRSHLGIPHAAVLKRQQKKSMKRDISTELLRGHLN
jgi:transposase